jgi:hypothetical protein
MLATKVLFVFRRSEWNNFRIVTALEHDFPGQFPAERPGGTDQTFAARRSVKREYQFFSGNMVMGAKYSTSPAKIESQNYRICAMIWASDRDMFSYEASLGR